MSKRVGVTFRNPEKVVPYEQALLAVGVEPVRLHPDSPGSLEGLDGLLLTGGTDVNPARYGQEPHKSNDEPDDPRDRMETALLASALERDLPVLAICRGMQLFNVAHGGTLEQHVENHRRPGVSGAHRIGVEPRTRLADAMGFGSHVVNSRHHQVVGRIGDSLRVSARSEEGYAEALERQDKRFAVAVQWHPEDLVAIRPEARRLFEAFAASLGESS
ncbi:MAG TPA: gamma-glutamyl-gamma-aminobutyrate hydrolase family protein [Bryobacteraceae bacterium]|jgi:gamma-glutamyl-gamma-aminobutyrate hydrolase PuuD|nr:gamma-glutamyl-gamma-aminobutyrate hydrolase family protein [Bryobacteraceae bacterium]